MTISYFSNFNCNRGFAKKNKNCIREFTQESDTLLLIYGCVFTIIIIIIIITDIQTRSPCPSVYSFYCVYAYKLQTIVFMKS